MDGFQIRGIIVLGEYESFIQKFGLFHAGFIQFNISYAPEISPLYSILFPRVGPGKFRSFFYFLDLNGAIGYQYGKSP
jgi:hypothetical protein